MNFRIVTSLLPVMVFFGLTRVAAPAVAIGGGFVATAAVTYYNRRDRLIGFLTIYGFVIVAVCAAIGIVGGSEKAYLASGPVSDFLLVPLYLGSVLIRRPLIGGVSRELVPAVTERIPRDAGVFMWLSVLWAFSNLVQGFVRWWLLEEYSVGEYLILSRVLTWPITGVVFAITAIAIYREARRYGFDLRAWLMESDREPLPASD